MHYENDSVDEGSRRFAFFAVGDVVGATLLLPALQEAATTDNQPSSRNKQGRPSLLRLLLLLLVLIMPASMCTNQLRPVTY